MFVYNVTIKVDHQIAEAWLHWMKNEHIPEIMLTNCFTSYRIVKILDVDETEGLTFAVQYNTDSKEDYNKYIEEFAPELRKKTIDKWGNSFIAFRTLMEVVQ